jgi:hypothetical protein
MPALWQAGFVRKFWLFHEGDVGTNGPKEAVDLNHGDAVECEVGQLVDADVAPFLFDESCDIAKSDMFVRGILC